ncbi:MAG: 50S ribosomal protein L23 [Candidatus Absconditabacteria bacterium]|nr:50S ribosomal protein L23 [Candidatus Absconditabacteria bacterium]MDD3868405.1 50S ribosomal protein L23 [Candidatus Absconditabacteria bacterium]MDD4714071.1 50S ribosomal protein L23 [Candidatus Absconditabacteria bacterium]
MTFRQKLQRRAIKNVTPKALQSFSPYDIILAPVLTEKAYGQQESTHKYTFKVHKSANKTDVKQAVAYLYKVTPVDVNIVNVPFKGRSQRKLVRADYKKAIVTLAEKDKIEVGL